MPEGRVLITGCSTGIGRAAALALARAGCRVLATARRPETIADLAGRDGIEVGALDVTQPDQCRKVVAAAEPLDALVNNAGFGQLGPLETLPEEKLREQFEVNVFALHRLTQLVLPGMRGRRRGRVVHVGSIVGKFAYPFGGAYCASKHAVEALTDALRMEVAPFGIRVVLIEPGPIKTRFLDTARAKAQLPPAEPGSPYAFAAPILEHILNESASSGAPPEAVARAIVRAVCARRPATRYVVTAQGRIFLWLRRLLPDAFVDWMMRTVLGAPGFRA